MLKPYGLPLSERILIKVFPDKNRSTDNNYKKIGKGEYAYLAVREGKKVVHKYLGTTSSPRIAKMILDKKETSRVPERLKFFFWDTTPDKIHIKRNARYIIERIMTFGDLDSLNWPQRVYPTQTIIDVLITRGISMRNPAISGLYGLRFAMYMECLTDKGWLFLKALRICF